MSALALPCERVVAVGDVGVAAVLLLVVRQPSLCVGLGYLREGEAEDEEGGDEAVKQRFYPSGFGWGFIVNPTPIVAEKIGLQSTLPQ